MATAEEILQEMEAEANAPVLTIDNDLRTIAIPDDVAILGVESDDDVHRLHFRMPKMCGEFDLSEFKLRVNIMNAGNEPDLYEVKDNAVEGDAITFSWLVGRTAAKYKGDVKFSVCAKLLDKDGVVQKEFNTTPAKLPVLEGLEVSEAVVQLHPDIIEAILLRLSKLETSGGVTDEQIANALSEYLQEHPIEAGATKEQAAQIQKNKEDIEDLKKNGTGSGDPAGTVSAAVNEHNTDDGSHEDIRQLIIGLSNRLNGIADSDDTTLDQLSEIVAYIKSNKSLIDAITTGKVSTSDIVDNLTTNVGTKVLSAAQGVALKGLIDGVVGQLNEQKEANAAQDTKIDKKANDADLAAVAKSGSYNDLKNKPTIPTVPTALKNPNALTFTGAVSATYDGSSEVSVEIPAGGGVTTETLEVTTTEQVNAITLEFSSAIKRGHIFTYLNMPGGGTYSGNRKIVYTTSDGTKPEATGVFTDREHTLIVAKIVDGWIDVRTGAYNLPSNVAVGNNTALNAFNVNPWLGQSSPIKDIKKVTVQFGSLSVMFLEGTTLRVLAVKEE